MLKWKFLLIGFILIIRSDHSAGSEPLVLTLEKAIGLAMEQALPVRISETTVELAGRKMGALPAFPTTDLLFQQGRLYSQQRGFNIEIMQNLGSIPEYVARNRVATSEFEMTRLSAEITRQEVIINLTKLWYTYQYLEELLGLKSELVDHYREMERISALRFRAGETGEDQILRANNHLSQSINELRQTQAERDLLKRRIALITGYDGEISIEPVSLESFLFDHSPRAQTLSEAGGLHSGYLMLVDEIAQLDTKVARSAMFPEISAGYFMRRIGDSGILSGWQVGLGIPLWFFTGREEVQKSEIRSEITRLETERVRQGQEQMVDQLASHLDMYFEAVTNYHLTALENAGRLEQLVLRQYDSEDIEYDRVLEAMKEVYGIRSGYLETINLYNQTAIDLQFYLK